MTDFSYTNVAILPFLLSFLFTLFITPLSLVLIKKMGLFDDPKQHKHPAIIHKKPVPRGGGIPLFLGIFLTSLFFITHNITTISLFIAALLALIVGVIDDKKDISPYFRFGMNIVTALIVVASGISIRFITHPFGGILHLDTFFPFLPLAASILWIVWVMNMLNWSKGVDGQMPGIVTISAIVIGILSLRFSIADPTTIIAAQLSFIIAGATLGFLPFNFYPARIFPGYGATSVYLLLAAVSILSGAKLATAILVMGVPMVDGIFTILRRVSAGKSPFRHDNKHLHHMLLRLGLNQRSIALFYWCISAILGAISLLLESRGKLFAIIMLVVVATGALLFLHIVVKKDEKNTTL